MATSNLQPIREIPGDATKQPRPGMALCLSGGGYRAMVFHLGSLWRLNEAGLLKKLSRISSVSGGSITAGMLGLQWKKLSFDGQATATNLLDLVINPVLDLAGQTLDVASVLGGILNPFKSISDEIADAYRSHLYGHATLQDLPSDNEGPRFVINATNVQTKVLWRFSKPYMGDYRVGLIKNPTVQLAVAVGASSAFPPVLSPVELKVHPQDFDPATAGDLQKPPFNTDVILSDGGVYDNLGLETAWKEYQTILVSDGGGATADDANPHKDWVQHAVRILELLDNQVGSLRKRWVVGSFESKQRDGTYWGIRTDIADYELADAMNCPLDRTTELANTPTRLKAIGQILKQRLVNWGYAVCDAALRKHLDSKIPAPKGFPYPAAGI
ncbi:MAG: patatin-like phospholipase family protein [Acidobacteriia bacterium]|nr:patatin-like phospholipase family protein [Terriglobia bacterium]